MEQREGVKGAHWKGLLRKKVSSCKSEMETLLLVDMITSRVTRSTPGRTVRAPFLRIVVALETLMGLADWFSTFCADLQVQDDGTISSRYKAITRRLNIDFWATTSDTAHSLYVGSYGRNTAIRGFSDLDMIFELPSSLYTQHNAYVGNGQSALLQKVKTSIETTYSTTNIKADGQVIQVPFTDGITFEVVPVFLNTANTYTHPDANGGGSWKTTNPRPELEAIRTRACSHY